MIEKEEKNLESLEKRFVKNQTKSIFKNNATSEISEFLMNSPAGTIRTVTFLLGLKTYSFKDKTDKEISGCKCQFTDGKLRKNETELGCVIQEYNLRLKSTQSLFKALETKEFPLEVVIEVKMQTGKTSTSSLTGMWPIEDIK